MGKEVLGEFEHQVLLAILRLKRESYTVPIVQELERRTGREVAPAAVYIALKRLQKRGMLTSRLTAPEARSGQRRRRYFRIEEPAMAALRESRRTLSQLWEGLEPLLDEQS